MVRQEYMGVMVSTTFGNYLKKLRNTHKGV